MLLHNIFLRLTLLSFLLSIIPLTPPINAQSKRRIKTFERKTSEKEELSKNYAPFYNRNERIKINDLSFERRPIVHSSNESLDIAFSLDNMTSETLELYAFVVAFYECDALSSNEFIKQLPQLKWRKRNFAKEIFFVLRASMSPKDILPNEIWSGVESDDYIEQKKNLQELNRYNPGVNASTIFPPIWKYSSYMQANPKKGIRMFLKGDPVFTKKELKGSGAEFQYLNAQNLLRINENGRPVMGPSTLRYTLSHSPRRILFRSFHYYPKSTGFFNKVLIQIYEASKIMEHSETIEESYTLLLKKIVPVKL